MTTLMEAIRRCENSVEGCRLSREIIRTHFNSANLTDSATIAHWRPSEVTEYEFGLEANWAQLAGYLFFLQKRLVKVGQNVLWKRVKKLLDIMSDCEQPDRTAWDTLCAELVQIEADYTIKTESMRY